MNNTQGILLLLIICIFIYVIYRFLWKRKMISRIINKLQCKSLKCRSRCKNDECQCNTVEGLELFGTTEGEYNSLIESEGTSIVSLPPDESSTDSREKPTLKDYVIKSSYNSAVTGKSVNIDMVKYLLSRGVRLLDFEVLLIDDKPMITYTNDTQLETIETVNTLLLDNVFSMISTSAFVQPTPNLNDPLFIHLRIKSKGDDTKLYKLISKAVDSNLTSRLYTGEVSKQTKMSDIQGKIVLIIDKTIDRNYNSKSTCNPEERQCYNLSMFVNLESGSDKLFLHRYTELLNLNYDHIRVEDKCRLCTSTRSLRLVMPDIINTNTKNPDINSFILNYGAQFVLYKFYSKDDELEQYEQMFNDNRGGIIPLAYTIDYLKKQMQ
jgi:hypothetical protein